LLLCYGEIRSLLVAELAGDKEVPALEDTQARCDWYRIKVLDLQRFDLLSLVLDPALEQVSILRLQQEEKGTLIISSCTVSYSESDVP
jgi:hypothetical protein